MEQDHSLRRREEAKRIRLEQERDHVKFLEQLKQMKKEVNMGIEWREAGFLHLFLPGKLQHFSVADLEREAVVGCLSRKLLLFCGIFGCFLGSICLVTLGGVILGLKLPADKPHFPFQRSRMRLRSCHGNSAKGT